MDSFGLEQTDRRLALGVVERVGDHLDLDASEDTLMRLEELTERYLVVGQSLTEETHGS